MHLTEPAELFKGLGFDFWSPPIPAVLGPVAADGPAARAGLKTGDRIVAIGGSPTNDFRDIVTRIKTHPGESLDITYRRGSVDQTVAVRVASEEGPDGKLIGRIKVAQPPVTLPDSFLLHTDFTLVGALGRATEEAWSMTVIQGRLVTRMLTGHVSVKNLSGPLSIAEYAGESAEAGAASFLEFLVLISLSLGFLNMLPIPILDGGQIVFQAVEWLKGSPLSRTGTGLWHAGRHSVAHPSDGRSALQRYRAPVQLNALRGPRVRACPATSGSAVASYNSRKNIAQQDTGG